MCIMTHICVAEHIYFVNDRAYMFCFIARICAHVYIYVMKINTYMSFYWHICHSLEHIYVFRCAYMCIYYTYMWWFITHMCFGTHICDHVPHVYVCITTYMFSCTARICLYYHIYVLTWHHVYVHYITYRNYYELNFMWIVLICTYLYNMRIKIHRTTLKNV